jgi:GTP-binding protein
MEEADALIQVVDATAGVNPLDETVARLLLRTGKRLILAVNKVDSLERLTLLGPFYGLGIKTVIGVSALHNVHVAELLQAALDGLMSPEGEEEMPGVIKLALVGRPNVGKSTIINHLLKEERCVVSPIPGTTRDSIDIPLTIDGQSFLLIDTAGIRRKGGEHEAVDKFAAVRTERAIERADVCALVVDAERGMTIQERRIARHIEEQGKGCILLFNKWDLVKGFRMEHCKKSFEIDLPFLTHCPLLFISGKTGRNMDQIFRAASEVHVQQNRRITTGQLNKFVERAVQECHPPMLEGGKRLRIYYLAQVDVSPPRFILFVNNPRLLADTYKKYLINAFRKEYGFSGSPVQFFLKARSTKEKEERFAARAAAPLPELTLSDLEFENEPSEEELATLDSSYGNV